MLKTTDNINILYEVIPIRLFLIVMLVFYHAFAIFSGAWSPVAGYPEIQLYNIMDKLSYACLLETFVFISGYIFGFQYNKKKGYILETRSFFVGKFKRLILPSFLFSILYILVFQEYDKPIVTIVYNILCGTGHMWFLPMLFWCFVFISLAEKTRISDKYMTFILIIMLFISVLPLPFRIDTAMYFFVFFYAGYSVKKHGLSIPYNETRLFLVLLVSFVLIFALKLNICEFDCCKMLGGGIFCMHFIY